MLNDESIYLHWAQLISDDRKNLAVPLQDGRQPLFIWVVSLFIPFCSDPLVAGRIVSVFSGFVTLAGVIFLTYEVFKKKEISFLAGLLYAVFPFAVMYDRLALLDSMVGMFTVWSIYFTVLLVRHLRLDIAYTLGFIIGGSLLTKSNGVFNLYLLPVSLFLLKVKRSKFFNSFIRWFLLVVIVFVVSQIVQAIITVVPNYHRILDVNAIFVIPKREFIVMPPLVIVSNFIKNFGILFSFLISYFAFPYTVLLIAGLLIGKQFMREKAFLLLYFLLPFLALALFGRFLLPRYIYFMVLPLLPICAYGMFALINMAASSLMRFLPLDKRQSVGLVVCLSVLYPSIVSLLIAYDLQIAPVPKAEKINYVSVENSFTKESIAYLQKESQKQKIILATDGRLGWIPNLYQVRLYKNPNIQIVEFEPNRKDIVQEVTKIDSSSPTYFITSKLSYLNSPIGSDLEVVIEKKFKINDGMREITSTLYGVEIFKPEN